MANKVMIVGTGNVGMSYGYALVHQRTSVNELVLVDINTEDAEGVPSVGGLPLQL